jgi:hypothetical protein
VRWHLHRWSKWTRFEEEWVRVNSRTGQEVPYIKLVQDRTCEVCGKTQSQEIR